MNLTVENNKKLYAEYIENIFNKAQFDQIDQYAADDYTLRDAPEGLKPGKDAIIQVVSMFKEGFPDFKITLDHLIGEGEFVSSKATFSGTHRGAIFGCQPSGKKVCITSLAMVRIKDGKILESWVRSDIDSLKAQVLQ